LGECGGRRRRDTNIRLRFVTATSDSGVYLHTKVVISLSHSFCVWVCVCIYPSLSRGLYVHEWYSCGGSVRSVEKMGFNGLFARILPFIYIYIHYTLYIYSTELAWWWQRCRGVVLGVGDLARRVWHMCQKQGRKSRQTYSRTGLLPSPHPLSLKRAFVIALYRLCRTRREKVSRTHTHTDRRTVWKKTFTNIYIYIRRYYILLVSVCICVCVNNV